MEGTNGSTPANQGENPVEQEANPNMMWGYYNGAPVMLPQWQEYWQFRWSVLEHLGQLRPPHVSEEARAAYYQYITDQLTYITNYIYGGFVNDYSVYEGHLKEYRASNPKGTEVMDKQEAWLEKQWSTDPNNKVKQTKVPSREPKVVVEKKEEAEPIRKDDPKIDLEELRKTAWNETKYPKVEELLRPNINLIFIGHVDAGKSTLSGRILKNLKLVDEQELKKNEQEAKSLGRTGWDLAFITSAIPDERAKGKTVECSKTLFALDKRRYTLFDAPGHKNYVPNMIIGACQSDLAVLIISAKQGEYQSGFDKEGQTKEHAMLARALGVHSLFCVVTKMDTIEWDQERFNKIQTEVSQFLKSACGYDNVRFIPVDSLLDINIDNRNYEKVCKWYHGESLFEMLDTIEVSKKSSTGALRIPITDKFKDQGHLYVFGKVESGALIEDHTVSLLPTKKYFIIKEIFNARDERLPYAPAGENVKLKVKDLEEEDVNRGNIICNNLNYCQVCYQFQARLHVLELPEKKLLSTGSECVIHMHTIVDGAEIVGIEAAENPETKKLVKATFLRSGQTGVVRIKVNNEVCLEKFDFMESLGRFTLRDEGKTIAFGEVTKIKPSQNLTVEQKAQLGAPSDKTKEVEKPGPAATPEKAENAKAQN